MTSTHLNDAAGADTRAAATPVVALRTVATSCTTGSCPTVYHTDRDTVVVQGYAMTAESAGVDLPEGELLVEIPVHLLRAASDSLT